MKSIRKYIKAYNHGKICNEHAYVSSRHQTNSVQFQNIICRDLLIAIKWWFALILWFLTAFKDYLWKKEINAAHYLKKWISCKSDKTGLNLVYFYKCIMIVVNAK